MRQQWSGSGRADGERYGEGGGTDAAAAEYPTGMTPVEAAGSVEPSASTLESIDGWDIGGVEFTDLGIPSITRQPLWLVFSAENGGRQPVRSEDLSNSGSSGSSQDEGVQGGTAQDAGPSPVGFPEQQQQMARGGEEGGETAHIAEALLLRADAAAGDSLPLQRRGGGASSSSSRQQNAAGAAAARSTSKSGRPAKPRKRGAGNTSDEGLGFDPDEGWALGGAEGK